MEHEAACCRSEHKQKKSWYRDPLILISCLAAVLIALSYFFHALEHFRHSFYDYVRMIWLPIVIGFVAGGLVDYYIPREYISKFLSQKSKRTVFYATALGFLASACSHGIIALSMELHKKGASGPAVVSFLLASPWANLPITLLLLGFFGAKGLIIIFCALLVSINTGLIFQVLDQKGLIEHNRHTPEIPIGFSIRKDLSKRFSEYRFHHEQLWADLKGVAKGTLSLADMVLWWLILGMLLASLISAFVPASIFQRFLGPSLVGLLITVVAAAVLEICSEGTSPLAFEIYKQTHAFGNSFVFLMGGVVTDYTEIGLVWMNLGKKTAIWMILVALPQVILLGFILNLLF